MVQLAPELESRLAAKTSEYWRLIETLERPDRLVHTLKWYIDELLPLEMPIVRSASPALAEPCHTLVLLVGYSLEPLLQAICFYQPRRMVLVLSKNYGPDVGDVVGKYIEKLVGLLTESAETKPPLLKAMPLLDPKTGRHFQVVRSDPAHVFQLLLRQLRSERPEQVIVDITGARKSMVAGAFFYAAFADVAISYVEFDDTNYNLKLGRPEGFRSVIRRLPNPYAAFELREWVRVRYLYIRYDFRSAQETLAQDILPAMNRPAPDSDEPFFLAFGPS